mgnify:CR=1 FL=1
MICLISNFWSHYNHITPAVAHLEHHHDTPSLNPSAIIMNIGLHDASMVKAQQKFVDLSNSLHQKHGVEFIIHSPTFVNLTIPYAKTHTGDDDGITFPISHVIYDSLVHF